MEQEFDLFDFARSMAESSVQETEFQPENVGHPVLSRSELRQAAMAFLAAQKPDGIAANVPTRRSKYRVAAAGFWRPVNCRKNHTVSKTAIVVMYNDLDCCFSDCAGRDEHIATISALQEEKIILETEIREKEPHLGSTDDLFGEFQTWDYAATADPRYRKICRKLDKELKLLNSGSKLDYIRRAGNADLCYLAIPENLLDPAAIPAEWGVVELTASPRGFRLVRQPLPIADVTPEGRMQLALNIASAAAGSACFANGVDANGKIRRPPKKRRY